MKQCPVEAPLAALVASPVWAQTFPAKPVRVIVPYAPGSATDIMSRVVAQRLGDDPRQSVVIDNKPGGNTGIGAELVARSAGRLHADVHQRRHLRAQPRAVRRCPTTWRATSRRWRPGLPEPRPVNGGPAGEQLERTGGPDEQKSGTISYGSYGVGSQAHLMGEIWEAHRHRHRPRALQRAPALAVADVIGGQVVFTFPAIPTVQELSQGRQGQGDSDLRRETFSQLPTCRPSTRWARRDMDIGAWYAFFAPGGYAARGGGPPQQGAVATMLGQQEFVDRQLTPQGMLPMNNSVEHAWRA